MLLTGGQVVVNALKEEGVDLVFGYPGGMALPLYDCLYDSGITHILTRHEQGAVHAADGYARLSGKVGVCISTSGPGATNLVSGIANAYIDSVPMVCITCQVVTSVLGKDSFQEADISGITTPITKHNFMVKDKDTLSQTIAEAFYIARTGRPGPVVVDIPKDIFTQEIWYDYPKNIHMKGYKPLGAGNADEVSRVADALAAAQRPLIMIGGGTVLAESRQAVLDLLQKTGAPLVSTLMGLSLIERDHPQHLGMIGMHGTFAANMAACQCDMLLALGCRFSDRVTGLISKFAPTAKIAHFDIDPSEINKIVRPRFRVLGDLRWSLPLLAEKAQEGHFGEWLTQCQAWAKAHPLKYDDSGDAIKPQAVIQAVNGCLADDAVVVTDVGQHQMWAAQYSDIKGPRSFLTSGGLGIMGFGLPAAIGAWLAAPEREVWLYTGDGSIMMNCQEIATAVELGCPVKVVILNNNGLGMVRQWQRLFYGNRYSGSQHQLPTDFVRLAKAFAADGADVFTKEELPAALAAAKAAKGPFFLNIRVENDENVMPMVAPNAALDQMIGY